MQDSLLGRRGDNLKHKSTEILPLKELVYPGRDNTQESKPLLIRIINHSQTRTKGICSYSPIKDFISHYLLF